MGLSRGRMEISGKCLTNFEKFLDSGKIPKIVGTPGEFNMIQICIENRQIVIPALDFSSRTG